MKKHLLILDNAVYPKVYKPFLHWKRFIPAEVTVTRVTKEEPLPPLGGFSHVLITGSEGSILDPTPWVDDQLILVRDAAEKGLPLLGSCHGHQMVAVAFGGKEAVRRSPTPEFGWVEIDMVEEDPIFSGAVTPPWTFCSHFDEVSVLPERCTLLARSARCAVQVFRVEGAPVYGIQAHPEILPKEGEDLLADFTPLFPAIREHPVLRPVRETGLAEVLMKNFLDLP
ncbi:MAG: type 1 glutamine amidotransferase [Planctomycetota bacterium]|jgi:GMP synthase-like glutamine amidotransferase